MFKKLMILVLFPIVLGGCSIGGGTVRLENRTVTITCPGAGADGSALEDEQKLEEEEKTSWTI